MKKKTANPKDVLVHENTVTIPTFVSQVLDLTTTTKYFIEREYYGAMRCQCQ